MSNPTRASRRVALLMAIAFLLAATACRSKTIQAYPDELAGIGVVLQAAPQGPTVQRIVLGGPADLAGLREGDRVVAVDGEATAGRSLASVVDMLRGRDGTEVRVAVDNHAGRSVIAVRRRLLAREGDGYRTK